MNGELAEQKMNDFKVNPEIFNFIADKMVQKKELFLVLSSVEIAFQFAYNLLNKNIKVRIEQCADNAFKECGISPYDVIEMNETFSAEAIMDFITEHRYTWSQITIVLAK